MQERQLALPAGWTPLNSLVTVDTTSAKAREIVVRASTEDDVPAMLAIYAHHIQRGLGAFEPLHGDDIKRRRKNTVKRRLPHLVAEQSEIVIGYAYAVPFRKRPAYRYIVKHSIYVHADHLHSGVGRRLLPALIDDRCLCGSRLPPDDRLHRRFQHAVAAPARGAIDRYNAQETPKPN